jgi:hypothetical protein
LLKKPKYLIVSLFSYLRGKVQRNQDLKTCKKIGRPKMLSDRYRRKLIRIIKALRNKHPNFTVKHLLGHCRLLSLHISCRTFYREVKAAGFDYSPARKKGVLTSRDRMKRKAFAQQCKKILSTKPGFFWPNIAFYSDGVSSVYKTQPISDALAPRGRVCMETISDYRVIKTLYNISVDYINSIIISMPTRMHAVLQADSFRIKN